MKTTLTMVVLLLWAGLAGAQTLKMINVPPSTPPYTTWVTGLSDTGEVVGYFYGGPIEPYGFWRAPGGTIHKIDPTSRYVTQALGVNSSGEVVGSVPMYGIEGAFFEIPPAKKPTIFLDHTRSYATAASSVNDAGWIVVYENSEIGGDHEGGCSIWTPQHTNADADIPSGASAWCGSINNLNQIVGGVTLTLGGPNEAFMYDLSTDSATVLSVPGAVETWATAINDSSEVVGNWQDANGISHGFTWTSVGGYVTFDVPGAVDTRANGINASGAIIGSFDESSAGCFQNNRQGCPQGFLLVNGTFTTIDVPKALITQLIAINSSGVVLLQSGNINKSGDRVNHTFLYTPAR
jgi:hypothetical protein